MESIMKMLISTTIIFLSVIVISHAQITEVKILPSDGTAGDEFGSSASIWGDYVIAGAFRDDNHKGSAYIFKRDGTNWVEEQKLTASDGAADDRFGRSVSIWGDYAIIGAAFDDVNGEDEGSAYIFRRDGTNWVEEQKLTASDGANYDWFGGSVSISEDYAIVGASWDDDNGVSSGSAYIFRRDGTSWIEEQKLTANDGGEYNYFGESVSISGGFVIIGADRDDDNGQRSGSAYIFKKDGTNWVEEQKLTASDGAAFDRFGGSVSISEDYVIVGASEDDNSKGSAYIFRRDGTNWVEEQKVTASDGEENDWFGCSVSISGNYAITGAWGWGTNDRGSAYIFRRDGTNWIEEEKILASDGDFADWFGGSVSILEDYVIVGASGDHDNGLNSGSAYIYHGFVPVNVDDEQSGNPTHFSLMQNYPNPFNPKTKINYQIPKISFVTIKIYDVLGNEIATLVNEENSGGSYYVEFDATALPSGVYFYQLKAGNFIETKKMVLLK
jgi:hypothetical protein